MCACGCFLLIAIVGGVAWCVMHALWLPAAGLVAFAALIGWLGRKIISQGR